MKEQRRLNLLFVWLISTVISVTAVIGGYYVGRAGDCSPGQVDGQCGMSTFFGFVYGSLAGLVIFVSMTIFVIVVAYRRNRDSANTGFTKLS